MPAAAAPEMSLLAELVAGAMTPVTNATRAAPAPKVLGYRILMAFSPDTRL